MRLPELASNPRASIAHNHQAFMKESIRLAVQNVELGGGPFGAIIIDKSGTVLARAAN
jgi:tRNA(Arg) A34 adenosine deaminase TadA